MYLCEFDGIDIQDIARVFHINTNRGSVATSIDSIQLGNIGEYPTGKKLGRRTVPFRFAFVDNDYDIRSAAIQKLNNWLAGTEERKLRTASEREGYLMAVCGTILDPAYHNRVETLEIEFIASDPRFYGNARSVMRCDLPVKVKSAYAPYIEIHQVVTNTIENPRWMVNGVKIEISGTIAPGKLFLAPEKGIVTRNGFSMMDRVTLDSRLDLFALEQGVNRVDCSNGAGGNLHKQERFM